MSFVEIYLLEDLIEWKFVSYKILANMCVVDLWYEYDFGPSQGYTLLSITTPAITTKAIPSFW